MKIDSILITAGFSSRMKKDKALIKIDNEYFINIILSKLITISEYIYIVLGHNKDLIKKAVKKEYLDKVIFVFNENYEDGMYSSIKKGISYSKNHILLHMIDQPFISKEFYKNFINSFNEEFYISQPLYNNKIGHPIILNKEITKNMKFSKDNNLRDFLKPFRKKMSIFETNDVAIFHNINNKKILDELINKM